MSFLLADLPIQLIWITLDHTQRWDVAFQNLAFASLSVFTKFSLYFSTKSSKKSLPSKSIASSSLFSSSKSTQLSISHKANFSLKHPVSLHRKSLQKKWIQIKKPFFLLKHFLLVCKKNSKWVFTLFLYACSILTMILKGKDTFH